MVRAGSFILGFIFILTGAILFTAKLGYLSPLFFQDVLSFWPVILILIGISIFWGGRIPRWLAFILVIVLVAGIILLGLQYGNNYWKLPGPIASSNMLCLKIAKILT